MRGAMVLTAETNPANHVEQTTAARVEARAVQSLMAAVSAVLDGMTTGRKASSVAFGADPFLLAAFADPSNTNKAMSGLHARASKHG